ncbi:MAG: mannose-6-phosphate isomerase [archaeon]|nr:mannose-6-phosphate isomerase [archaeon]
MNTPDYSSMPLKLKTNRVWRTYTGGKLIEKLQNIDNPKDSHFPEDWVASVTEACNPRREDIINEGLSKVDLLGKPLLKDLIGNNPEKFLGTEHYNKYGNSSGVLVKLLDSAERLAIQAHPNEEIAMNLFNSRFGKTEAWLIINTREIEGEKPYILFGFKPGITREKWIELFEDQNISEMVKCLHKIEIKPFELFLIPAGMPHAIGPGCFIVEIQEPTDYTIITERQTPKGLKASDLQIHQGIGFERMFDCFDYIGFTEEEIKNRWMLKSKIIQDNDDFTVRELITDIDTKKFSMNRITVKNRMEIQKQDSFSIFIIISGSGKLFYNITFYELNPGDQIFLPYNLNKIEIINENDDSMELIRCFPPK